MKPSELKNQVLARHKAGIKRPILIESSPGVGKTQICFQVAKELGIGFKAIHAPLLQPEDYGFPVISADKTTVDFIASKAKFPLENSDCEESGIFLIDEISQCDNSTQKILANLIHEREIHGLKIKSGWTIIATGNRTTDRAGSTGILSHLSNRMSRITLDVSLDDWTEWALDNNIKTEVISFIRFRPALLNSFDSQNSINATPRSWCDGVSALLGVVEKSQEFETFKADVGEGPAAEFLGFLKIFRELPNPDIIILGPEKADVPTNPATQYALCGALSNKTTDKNFGQIMKYIGRLPAEFGVLYIRDTLKLKPEIQTTKEFIKWASKDGAKLLS